MYGTIPIVKQLLNPRERGTIAGAIFIGTSGSATCGTTFAKNMLKDAGTFINGMIFGRYKLPFATIPNEIHFIANRLAAAYIIQACKLYTADSASNYLYDKQQTYEREAMTKLQAIADGAEILTGVQNEDIPQTKFEKLEFGVPGSANVRPISGP